MPSKYQKDLFSEESLKLEVTAASASGLAPRAAAGALWRRRLKLREGEQAVRQRTDSPWRTVSSQQPIPVPRKSLSENGTNA